MFCSGKGVTLSIYGTLTKTIQFELSNMKTKGVRRARIYGNKDANFSALLGRTVAVIGFGSQGHAHALNLKDSGIRVIIGLYPGSKSIAVAEEKGFEVYPTEIAVLEANVIFVAVPDTDQPKVYKESIEPYLRPGQTLLFSHGFSIHFKTIIPPPDVDVIMVAPKGPGHIVRRQFLEGKGVPSLIAVHQGGRRAKTRALAWAFGIGATRGGVIQTTFKEETETDLFGEQDVLCGGIAQSIHSGFEVLTEAGYSPEMAYFEVCHELKLIVDMINESGVVGMLFSISKTAKWGAMTVGPKIIDAGVKRRMEKALKNIQSGKFAREWIEENNSGGLRYKALLESYQNHPIEAVGRRLRALMPWMKKKNTKGAQAAY